MEADWEVCHPPMSMGQLTATAWAFIADAAGICVTASTAASQPKKFSQGPLAFQMQHSITQADATCLAWNVNPWTMLENDCSVQKMT